MRINKPYHKMFPNNCPVIEVTGDGVEVGTCTYYMPNGVCPRHGRLLTPLALDAAMPPSAEPGSGLESVPAVESDTQPRK